MDKEKEQELEWLKAQKIEISVDLFAAAKQQLLFLGAVDRNRWLYEGPALERAIYRYNAYWLPLLAKFSESLVSEGSLVPPLDCEWIWHCHRLNPVRYKTDCEQFYGRVLDNSGVVSSVNGNSKIQTENLWKRLYPEEPYDLDLETALSEDISEKSSTLEKCTKYDLVSAVKRQSPFYHQVSRAHVNNDIFLQEAVARYKGFLYLIKKNKEKSLRRFSVPTYDVDLIWHTHQLSPVSYCTDLKKVIGKVLEHDDTDSDRGKGKKLDTGFSTTTAQWEGTFGTRYAKAGAMYRGPTPAPVVSSPYASDGLVKEPTAKEDCQSLIQFPEVEVIEVRLEIVGVKNLPDGQKGKLFVVLSKTQPDSLFNAERRLTILPEVGQKQVASFKCEATGELRFQLISSSPSKIPVSREEKNLGFASLSLQELLFPVTQLSVEKWLELTPFKGKEDPKTICLRVAISFTPPTRSPSVVHMVQSRTLGKASCFFPIIGKDRRVKGSTHIVDKTQTEVVSLQMRNLSEEAPKGDHTAQRQVIGVVDSGETHVLAEYNGTFWSLLDSKWSLKQTNASKEDNPLFELVSNRVVKIFSGRKLDYEPKHCAKITSDQDFMTLIEFSKHHPYGKAVGLVDLKFGSIEAKENWVVLPGIISAFILNALLKKPKFPCFNATTTKEEMVKATSGGCTGSACDAGGQCGDVQVAASGGCSGSACDAGGQCGDVPEVQVAASGGCTGSACDAGGQCGDVPEVQVAASGGCTGSACDAGGQCGDVPEVQVAASGDCTGSACDAGGQCGDVPVVASGGCGGDCGGGGQCGDVPDQLF